VAGPNVECRSTLEFVSSEDVPPVDGPPPFEPDPVIEAYKKDVDRTLIRENLKRTPDERMRALAALLQFAKELGRAGREATGR
jgi:hypothetical protein